jgi:hypothetical protein
MKVNMISTENSQLMYPQMLDHLLMIYENFLTNDSMFSLDEIIEK